MNPIKVMVNGIPGNMATIVAKHVINDDRFEILPYSLTGPEITETEHVLESTTLTLMKPDVREEAIEEVKNGQGAFISVDYTLPISINENADFYCRHDLPFVMGTTGGDRQGLMEAVSNASIPAVIAPNMAKQIVGFQAMMEYASDTFQDLFTGYSLKIRESHQKGKADTSGTAKAMVAYFNKMGVSFTEQKIEKERDPDVQQNQWGVPEEYLSGHGWHTYTLLSEDRTVRFEFTHNVNGRDVYAKGALDAVLYLNKKIAEGATGKAFTMIDVLRGI